MYNEVRTSKFLSMILRHKPETVGITLDENGWADVQDLLNGMGSKGHAISLEQLKDIVATDDKQRYKFNDDYSMIRASQGHSIPVDVELDEVHPPEFLYHGTADRNLGYILKEGLKPQSRLYVHLSDNEGTAVKVGARHGKPVVLKVASGKMASVGHKFYLSDNKVWLTAFVSPEYISIL